MKKGWNLEYLEKQMNYWQQKAIEEPIYEQRATLYSELYFLLCSQQGKVYYEEVNPDEFLEEYNEYENVYQYDKNTNKKVNAIAKEFLNLPNYARFSYHDSITQQEKIELITAFLENTFGNDAKEIFVTYFKNHAEYVLYNCHDDVGSVTFIPNEIPFICIPKETTIAGLSVMAHEAGHLYRKYLNPTPNGTYDVLGEYESFGFEFSLIFWLIKNNLYKEEAAKYLLNNMKILEQLTSMRYLNSRYKLSKIKNSTNFKERVEELKIRKRLNFIEEREIYDYLSESMLNNTIEYLFSFLSVINTVEDADFYEKYQKIVSQDSTQNAKVLLKREIKVPVTNLKKYKEIRSSLLETITK